MYNRTNMFDWKEHFEDWLINKLCKVARHVTSAVWYELEDLR